MTTHQISHFPTLSVEYSHASILSALLAYLLSPGLRVPQVVCVGPAAVVDLDDGGEDAGDPVGAERDAVRLPDAPQRLPLRRALVGRGLVVQGEQKAQLLEGKNRAKFFFITAGALVRC